jgi:hypothetical protein
LGAIDVLAAPRFAVLWEKEFGAGHGDGKLVPIVMDATNAIRASYRPFAQKRQPTDTLVTKIVLGTLGCLPAVDRYFISGFKAAGFRYSSLNARFVDRILSFCGEHLHELQQEQMNIKNTTGVSYPLMKLLDMYFWQTGSERSNSAASPQTETTSRLH